jgi:hypothetical protein
MNVDSYGMREMGHLQAPGEMLYSSDPYTAGAAGIGVARARSMRVEGSNSHQPDYSAALKDGNSPYPAFAAPNPGHMPGGVADPYASSKNMELLGAAGLGAHMSGAGALAMPQHPYAQQQYGGSYAQGSLDRKRSVEHYYTSGYGSSAPGPAVPTNRYSVVNEDMEDAYGGVADEVDDPKEAGLGNTRASAPLPNPFERDVSEEGPSKDIDVESMHDEYGQGEPKRVLKVRLFSFQMVYKSNFVSIRLQMSEGSSFLTSCLLVYLHQALLPFKAIYWPTGRFLSLQFPVLTIFCSTESEACASFVRVV